MQKISKKHSMVICIAYIVLLLFLSFVGVYAWFTARANRSDDVNFATLEINIRSGSNTISDTDFTTTYLNNISPGSTVNFNTLSIANVGNAPVYTIIKLKLKFQMDGNDHSLIYYYNLNGELIDYKALENNSTPASLIEANQTKSVDLSFTFDGDEFTNDFKQNSVEVTFTALAIQSLIPADETGTYPTSELYAVYYLVEEVDTDTDIASNKVYFYDETGDDLIYIEYVNQNADSIYSGVPTKESTEMYSYVFTGWVDENNRPANLTNITSDVAVYASFSQTLREYELEIVNSTTANLTVTRQGNNLQNGAILHYGDILTISYTENQGSTGHLLVTGADLQSGNNYLVTGNVSIYYSEENIPYSLSIVNNTGAKITILRNDVIYNGGVVYYGDILEITFDSNAGYTGSISVSGASAQSGGYRVTGNVTITYTETRTPYSIQMINNTGAQLKVTRGDETITSSSTLYYDDILNISFVANAGKLGQLEVTGAVRSGGEFTYLVQDDVVITYSEILEDYFLLSVPNGVTVNRDGSDLSTGTIIHYGDVLTISYDLPDNYELVAFSVSGADLTSGNNYSVTGNVNVVFEINLVATPLPFEINENGEITAYTGTATEVTIPSTYSLLEDGTAVEGTDHTITGIADATSLSTGVFYNKNITSVTLPETLEKIGSYAFYRCTNLTSITIPDSVTSIGRYAFYNCRNLTEINFNATNMSDLSSGNRVFYNAGQDGAGITVNIGANVTRIPAYLFYPGSSSYAPNITEVNFAPNSQCTEIGSWAFRDCTNLISITLGEGITSIGNSAFYNCRNLTEININATNMSDLSLNNYAFYDVGQDGTGITVNIGANVTRIPAYLFYNSNIAEVNFAPNSQCTEIGNYAFAYCANLTSINIPDSVTGIGSVAFRNCTNLTSITIPDSVTSIETYAFSDCTNLTSVTIGEGVTSIGTYVFHNCRNLTEINFNATNMLDLSRNNLVFAYAGQDGTGITVNIGANVTRIPAYLFEPYYNSSFLTNITEVNFAPNSQCTEIGNYAFSYCTKLTSITIPDRVTSIGEYAFSDCTNLTSITIPDRVTSIGTYAFYACRNLTEINFNATNMVDLSSGNYVFAYAGQDGAGITVNIGANVTRIPVYLFYSGSAASSVDYSPNITEVNFASNSQCTEIGNCAFYDCNNLTSITIPDSVTSIGISAFYGSGITSITIPDSVTSIGDRAFYWCTNLTSITIGEGVASIGDWAFYASYSLVYVVNKSSLAFEVGDYGTNIYDNPMLEIVSDESEQNLIDIKGNRYKDYDGERYFIKNLDGSSEIEIDSTCTQIYQYAFYNNENITSITIPEGVTSIGESVFKGCTNLESIIVEEGNAVYHCEGNCLIETASKRLILGCKNSVIPTDGSVTSIGDWAFYGSGIASITIPDSVTSIGNYAFYNCTNLISITIGEGITSIGSYAFSDCDNLTSITIPDSVTSIGNSAFYNCDNLTSVTIGNGVTSIGSSAFSYCTNLTSVSIGEGVTSIGSSAFSVCINLTSVTIESNYAYANATSASACGYLLQNAIEVRVLTSCIDSSVNSYLENTSNFSWTTDGEYTVYTKVA